MLDITLSKMNSTHWFISGEATLGEATPMYVNFCHRCIGALMLFVRKPHVTALTSKYLTLGLHAQPGQRRHHRLIWNKYLQPELTAIRINYDAKEIHICGGLIDSPENRYLFQIASGQLIGKIKHLFSEAAVFQTVPTSKTRCSTLYMNEDFHVLHEQF